MNCLKYDKKIDVQQEVNSGGQWAEETATVHQKKRKIGLWVGFAAVAVILFVIIGCGSGRNREAEKLVQDGALEVNEDVSVREVFENYWPGGIWDSFEYKEGGETYLLVEYAKEKARNSLIQFSVDMESEYFEIYALSLDGEEIMDYAGLFSFLVDVYSAYYDE